MKSCKFDCVQLIAVLAFLNYATGNVIRAACETSSAYTLLSKASTGSAFCSSLLYPKGVSTTTVEVTVTSTKLCKTKTTTETYHTTTTVFKTRSTTLPTITQTQYSSTVLIPSGSHQPVAKRVPQASVSPAAGPQACAATPSGLCNCPVKTLSAACSSLVPPPTTKTSTKTDTTTIKCSKTEVTLTTTLTTKTVATTTLQVSPPPIRLFSNATLTATVPAACASSMFYSSGNTADELVVPVAGYPYFPYIGVECCTICYRPEWPNCIAVAYITDGESGPGSLVDCELLIFNGTVTGTQESAVCPLGAVDYVFGTSQTDGNVFPGPCGY